MPKTYSENYAGPSLGKRGHMQMGFQDHLESLFTEVSALAIRLRQGTVAPDSRAEIPAGGWGILQILERHGPQTVPQIARLRSTSRQNIQVLVNRLEVQDWVELAENPAHKRSVLVRLTEGGRRRLVAKTEREAKVMKDLLPRLSEAEVVNTAALLRRLRLWLAGDRGPSTEIPDRETVANRAPRIQERAQRDGGVPAPVKPHQPPPPAAVVEEEQLNENQLPVSLL